MTANLTSATEYAENVCRSLNLPIRGVAFTYIENAIQAAIDERAAEVERVRAALDIVMWHKYDGVVRCAWCDCFKGDEHKGDCDIANTLKGGE